MKMHLKVNCVTIAAIVANEEEERSNCAMHRKSKIQIRYKFKKNDFHGLRHGIGSGMVMTLDPHLSWNDQNYVPRILVRMVGTRK